MSTMRSTSKSVANESESKSHRLFLRSNIDYNCKQDYEEEKLLPKIKFNKKIFSPDCQRPILFLSTLVEFGCESLLPHYFLPNFAHGLRDYRKIGIGWPGRSLFYKNYLDEFWEIDPKYAFLRGYTKAFTGMSKNIKNIECALEKYGKVYKSAHINNFFCEAACVKCKKKFYSINKMASCPTCQSEAIINSIIGDTNLHRSKYVPLDLDFTDKEDWLSSVVKTDKAVGIFARNRKAYGRNLSAAFYKKFCAGLVRKGYEILWLGEKVSTLKCVSKDYFDFTKSDKSDDLSACFGLVGKCAATFQAWTASTRFSQATNTPFCLVESFDQLFGNGQEGKRINLLTKDLNKKKIIISNFYNATRNDNYFADLCLDHFCDFIENKNSNDVVGMVERPDNMRKLLETSDLWKTI